MVYSVERNARYARDETKTGESTGEPTRRYEQKRREFRGSAIKRRETRTRKERKDKYRYGFGRNDLIDSRRFIKNDDGRAFLIFDRTQRDSILRSGEESEKLVSTVVSHCQIIIIKKKKREGKKEKKKTRQAAFIVWIDRSLEAPPVFINPHSGSVKREIKGKKKKGNKKIAD